MSYMTEPTPEKYYRYLMLLNDYEKHLQHFCLSHTDSRQEACTLMQEIMANIWERWDTHYADATPQQTNRWLQRIMYSTFIEHLRLWKWKNIDTVLLDEIPEPEAPDNGDMELLDELLGHLAPQERDIVDDHLAGFTHSEIASRHNITKNAVSQRMHRIIDKLKKIKRKYYD